MISVAVRRKHFLGDSKQHVEGYLESVVPKKIAKALVETVEVEQLKSKGQLNVEDVIEDAFGFSGCQRYWLQHAAPVRRPWSSSIACWDL